MTRVTSRGRIEACISVCEGIDTELLEPKLLGNTIAAKMAVMEARDALGRANVHLIAALSEVRDERDEAQAKLQKWLDVFGHLSHDPDEAGNIIYEGGLKSDSP